jgi:hypothetical protein
MATEKPARKKEDKELEDLIKMADSIDVEGLLNEIKIKELDTFPELEGFDEEVNTDAFFIDLEDIEVELKPITTLSLESRNGLKTVLIFLKELSPSPERDRVLGIIKKIMEEEGF